MSLEKCTEENTPEFSLAGEYAKVKVLRVIDGDTVCVALKLPKFGMSKIRVRLIGIDAPETRTKNLVEKEAGVRSKKELREMVEGKVVGLIAGKFDNFGRVLGRLVFEDKTDVGQKLVDGGFATEVKFSSEAKTQEKKPRKKRTATPSRSKAVAQEDE
jgi:micrococcal nuclease